jgi:ribosomal protein S27E
MNNAPKAGDKCIFCKEGVLVISPSGQHLICPKCGLVIVAPKPKSPSRE